MDKDQLTARARTMRNEPTEPEKRLWRHLSGSQLEGFKFRRQTVVGAFIVDFLCPAKLLVVEVDGETHDAASDARRDERLEEQGYRTLRFTNAEVMGNMEGVLITILDALRSTRDRWPHPNPSPEGEGLERHANLSPSPSGEGLGVGPSSF